MLEVETKEIRNEKTIVIFQLSDFTDTFVMKIFVKKDQCEEILSHIKKGAFLKVKGVTMIDRFDSQLTIGSLVGIKKIQDFRVERKDTYAEKRVELHCHTKMSDMDGVSDVKDIIKRAAKWGHKAIAITDHGVVQAFTDANHAVSPDDDFKVIYGTEAYLVDDCKVLWKILKIRVWTEHLSYLIWRQQDSVLFTTRLLRLAQYVWRMEKSQTDSAHL